MFLVLSLILTGLTYSIVYFVARSLSNSAKTAYERLFAAQSAGWAGSPTGVGSALLAHQAGGTMLATVAVVVLLALAYVAVAKGVRDGSVPASV